jgi:hypothetical protein
MMNKRSKGIRNKKKAGTSKSRENVDDQYCKMRCRRGVREGYEESLLTKENDEQSNLTTWHEGERNE